MARLQERYEAEIKGQLQEKFQYENVMQIPRLHKVVINMGLGEAIQNPKALDAALADLTAISAEAFRAVYGEEPRIAALHAGLECGILSGKMPELDCISFGPDLTNIHTPGERLHIASTERTWLLTLETLKRLSMHEVMLDVNEEDQLVLLVTCVGDDDERLVVAARRMREGEQPDRLSIRNP